MIFSIRYSEFKLTENVWNMLHTKFTIATPNKHVPFMNNSK